MRNETIRSINHSFKYPSLWLLAAAVCLCPATAQAQTITKTGEGALANVTSGYFDTADGYEALHGTTTGAFDTASGARAAYANTTGYYNTAIGATALAVNTTGNNNTAVGTRALLKIRGSDNIALGGNAGEKTSSGNKNIYIGHNGINGRESRVMRIGKAQTRTFIAGIAGTALSGASVVIKPNGQLGVIASSARYKQDIRTLSDASSKLARLRPVSYRYKTEPEATHYGLIAEEVDKVMPELVVRDEKNRPETVQYHELIPLLLQQWKAQRSEIARLETAIGMQRAVIKGQQARVENQKLELIRQRALIERLAADVAELRRKRFVTTRR
jgi:hypothetical protein